MLSIVLVFATALAVGVVVDRAVRQQIEESADRRLLDGAAEFQEFLHDRRDDLLAASEWLARDQELMAANAEQREGEPPLQVGLALQFRSLSEVLLADGSGQVRARLQ